MGEDLLALATRVEAASGPDRELDAAIHEAVTTFRARRAGPGWPDEDASVVPAFPGWVLLPAYSGSLDAARSLVPSGWDWASGTAKDGDGGHAFMRRAGRFRKPFDIELDAATPALALTAACLRALASQVDHAR